MLIRNIDSVYEGRGTITDAGIEIGIKNTNCSNSVPGHDAVQFGIFSTALLQSNITCVSNYAVSHRRAA
jgi:hypothetical protein